MKNMLLETKRNNKIMRMFMMSPDDLRTRAKTSGLKFPDGLQERLEVLGTNACPERREGHRQILVDLSEQFVQPVKVAGTRAMGIDPSTLRSTKVQADGPITEHETKLHLQPFPKKDGTVAVRVYGQDLKTGKAVTIGYLPTDFVADHQSVRSETVAASITDWSNGRWKNVSYQVPVDMEQLAAYERYDRTVTESYERLMDSSHPVEQGDSFVYRRPLRLAGICVNPERAGVDFRNNYDLSAPVHGAASDDPYLAPVLSRTDLAVSASGKGYLEIHSNRELKDTDLAMVDAQAGNFLSDLAVNASFHWNRACYTFTDGGLTFPVPNEKFQLVTVPKLALELALERDDEQNGEQNRPTDMGKNVQTVPDPFQLTESDLLAIAELDAEPDELTM